MEKQQLKCEKCSNIGVLIVASVDEADQPTVYCVDHLVEYAQQKKTHLDSKQTEPVPSDYTLQDALTALRNARLAQYEKIQNTIQSESITSQINRASILAGLETEKIVREKVFGDDKK